MLNAAITAAPTLPTPVAPAPHASPAPNQAHANHAGNEAGTFARQLERAAQDGANADTAAAPQPDGSSGEPRNVRTPGRNDNERAHNDKPPARRSPAQQADGGSNDGASTDGTQHSSKAGAKTAASGAEPAPDLQALLASLMNRPAAAAARAEAAGHARAAGAADERRAAATAADMGTGSDGAGAALRGPADTPGGAATGATAAAGDAAPARPAAAGDTPSFSQLLASAGSAAAGGGAPAPAEAAAHAPAPYAAQVAAPVGSPDFAPGLSAQVSVMVRDGIQEARLQLNPADMGPITVQIQVDGDTAQVTMTAEQAPTRQALEQAMPTLAGALREEGLTLTGGGVFEQPRQARDDGPGQAPWGEDGRGGRGGRGSGDTGTGGDDGASRAFAAAAPRRAAARGGVDTYA
jgi:flagellar hook-length control protein FliK